MRRFSALLPLLLLLALSGCGTVLHGTTQDVSIDSDPRGAQIVVNGEVLGLTPATVRLKRGRDHIVTVRLDGYPSKRIFVRRRTEYLMVALNLVTTYGVGALVDYTNGAAYELDPDDAFVLLRPPDSTEAAPPPPVAARGPRRQNGPRFGVTFLAPGVRDNINRVVGEDRIASPLTTQFGWQLEFPTFQTEAGLTGVIEAVPLVGGLERGLVLPTVSLLAGARTPGGIELGVGPTLTLSGLKIDSYNANDSQIEVLGASLALVGGRSFDVGGAHVPVNGALVLGEGGLRLSVLVGLTTTSGRY